MFSFFKKVSPKEIIEYQPQIHEKISALHFLIKSQLESVVIKTYDDFDKFLGNNQYKIIELREFLKEKGIDKRDYVPMREMYLTAKEKGKASYIKKLYKDAEKAKTRKEKRKILYKDIPEAKEYNKRFRSFTKEDVRNIYTIKYVDELLILFTFEMIQNMLHMPTGYMNVFNNTNLNLYAPEIKQNSRIMNTILNVLHKESHDRFKKLLKIYKLDIRND